MYLRPIRVSDHSRLRPHLKRFRKRRRPHDHLLVEEEVKSRILASELRLITLRIAKRPPLVGPGLLRRREELKRITLSSHSTHLATFQRAGVANFLPVSPYQTPTDLASRNPAKTAECQLAMQWIATFPPPTTAEYSLPI